MPEADGLVSSQGYHDSHTGHILTILAFISNFLVTGLVAISLNAAILGVLILSCFTATL